MGEAGFKEIWVYILKRKNRVTQYIETRPIMELYKRLVQRLGDWVYRRQWQQEGIDLVGARERAHWRTGIRIGEEEKLIGRRLREVTEERRYNVVHLIQ